MSGQSMIQAKKALELFLHSMPVNCYFNIWSFGSEFSCLFKNGSKKYDDYTLSEAKNHTGRDVMNVFFHKPNEPETSEQSHEPSQALGSCP